MSGRQKQILEPLAKLLRTGFRRQKIPVADGLDDPQDHKQPD